MKKKNKTIIGDVSAIKLMKSLSRDHKGNKVNKFIDFYFNISNSPKRDN